MVAAKSEGKNDPLLITYYVPGSVPINICVHKIKTKSQWFNHKDGRAMKEGAILTCHLCLSQSHDREGVGPLDLG